MERSAEGLSPAAPPWRSASFYLGNQSGLLHDPLSHVPKPGEEGLYQESLNDELDARWSFTSLTSEGSGGGGGGRGQIFFCVEIWRQI